MNSHNVMWCFLLILFNSKYASSSSMGFKIDGLFDLGPKWNYKYDIQPAVTHLLPKNALNDAEQKKYNELHKDELVEESEELIKGDINLKQFESLLEIVHKNSPKPNDLILKVGKSNQETKDNTPILPDSKIIIDTGDKTSKKPKRNSKVKSHSEKTNLQTHITNVKVKTKKDKVRSVKKDKKHKSNHYTIESLGFKSSESAEFGKIKPLIHIEDRDDENSEIMNRAKDFDHTDAPPNYNSAINKTIASFQVVGDGTVNLEHKTKTQAAYDIHVEESTESYKSIEYKNKVNKKNKFKNINYKRIKRNANDNKSTYFIFESGNGRRYNTRAMNEDPKFVDFFVHIYKSSLRIFYDVTNSIDDYYLEFLVNKVIESYKTEYKKHLEKTKATVEFIDKVIFILDTIELVKNFTNELLEVIILKETKTNLAIEKEVRQSLRNILTKENDNVCKEFGICRSWPTFREFLQEFFGIIRDSEHAKMITATNTFINIFGTGHNMLADYEVIISFTLLPLGERYAALKELWVALQARIANDTAFFPFPSPVGGYKNVRCAALDAIPQTRKNMILWNKLKMNLRAFVNGNFPDGKIFFHKLKVHMFEYWSTVLKRNEVIEHNITLSYFF